VEKTRHHCSCIPRSVPLQFLNIWGSILQFLNCILCV
jgi:hypothetical protein